MTVPKTKWAIPKEDEKYMNSGSKQRSRENYTVHQAKTYHIITANILCSFSVKIFYFIVKHLKNKNIYYHVVKICINNFI